MRTIALVLLSAAAQDPQADRAFFTHHRVDFWKDGSAERKPASNPNESIWAEPVRLPDGRFTTYLPPRPVLEFLENPTRENAAKYLEWQSERMGKMRKAASLLAEIQRGAMEKRAVATGGPIAITYFKKAG